MEAVAAYQEPERILQVSKGLGIAMEGLETGDLDENQRMADRGW